MLFGDAVVMVAIVVGILASIYYDAVVVVVVIVVVAVDRLRNFPQTVGKM